MRRNALVFCFTFFSFFCHSQFGGIGSFFADTVLRNLVKSQRVLSVTEYVKQNDTLRFNGRYYFDVKGRVKETISGRGPYYGRMKFEYNDKGMVTKQTHYQSMDTSKVESWNISTFDSKNRMVKRERGHIENGKTIVNKEFEIKFISEKAGARRIEIKRYDGPKLEYLTLSRDSISGKDTLMVSYAQRVDETSGKKFTTEKTLSRPYKADDCFYEDEVEYKIYGKSEAPVKVRTHYHQLDAKGRAIDYGEINYEEAYEEFAQQYPDEFNINYYSDRFIKEVLQGKVKGKKVPDDKFTFDEKGLLIQNESQEYLYAFKYNEKNQMIEQKIFKEKELIGELLFWYNEKGLINKTLNTYENPNQPGEKVTLESAYTYTHY